MPSRKSIPAEITRQLLMESGHRCAVCGAPSPLERAHIVPLQEGGGSALDNLLCLCANCHARADLERWSADVLRAYKTSPWAFRRSNDEHSDSKDKVRVEVDLELSGQDITDAQTRKRLEQAIAAFLDVDPAEVRILSIEGASNENNR